MGNTNRMPNTLSKEGDQIATGAVCVGVFGGLILGLPGVFLALMGAAVLTYSAVRLELRNARMLERPGLLAWSRAIQVGLVVAPASFTALYLIDSAARYLAA